MATPQPVTDGTVQDDQLVQAIADALEKLECYKGKYEQRSYNLFFSPTSLTYYAENSSGGFVNDMTVEGGMLFNEPAKRVYRGGKVEDLPYIHQTGDVEYSHGNTSVIQQVGDPRAHIYIKTHYTKKAFPSTTAFIAHYKQRGYVLVCKNPETSYVQMRKSAEKATWT